MAKNRYILTDIDWTLFYANSTFDFLSYVTGKPCRSGKWNVLIYKLFGYDMARHVAIQRLKGYTREELTRLAEQFYQEYLLPRKIEPVWQRLVTCNNPIILVSGTLDVLAEVIAKHMGAKTYYASALEFRNDVCTGRFKDFLLSKREVSVTYSDFDIVTDNLTDIDLVKKANKVTIITYANQQRWQKILPETIKPEYIEADRNRY